MSYGHYRPYVSVAKRRANAQRELKKLAKKGVEICPVTVEGRKIARTFWGEAWCNHLEQFSDYENRLPRGKTYVRNGSVCHLGIEKGKVKAIVSGSELYDIEIAIKPLGGSQWKLIQQQCMGQIGSLLELLQGKLSTSVMQVVTHPKTGLFPQHDDIKLKCSCPDWAGMCKHLAAALYGVGAMLDKQPELLFKLRGVDHLALIGDEVVIPTTTGKRRRIASDVGSVFGIELDEGNDVEAVDTPAQLVDGSAQTMDAVSPGQKKRRASVKVLIERPPAAKETTHRNVSTAKASKVKVSTTKARISKTTASKATTSKATASKATASKATASKATASKATASKATASKATATSSAKLSEKRTTKPFKPTSTSVARLRKRLGMNAAQFAQLIGVSSASVSLWEGQGGPLNLREKSRYALAAIADLEKAEAWEKLASLQ